MQFTVVVWMRMVSTCIATVNQFLILFVFTGTEHDITFMYCQCEPLVITIVRAQLWPATAQRPHLAFTFGLLDWAEALLLECHVALKDLCKTLCFRCPHTCMTTKVQLFDLWMRKIITLLCSTGIL